MVGDMASPRRPQMLPQRADGRIRLAVRAPTMGAGSSSPGGTTSPGPWLGSPLAGTSLLPSDLASRTASPRLAPPLQAPQSQFAAASGVGSPRFAATLRPHNASIDRNPVKSSPVRSPRAISPTTTAALRQDFILDARVLSSPVAATFVAPHSNSNAAVGSAAATSPKPAWKPAVAPPTGEFAPTRDARVKQLAKEEQALAEARLKKAYEVAAREQIPIEQLLLPTPTGGWDQKRFEWQGAESGPSEDEGRRDTATGVSGAAGGGRPASQVAARGSHAGSHGRAGAAAIAALDSALQEPYKARSTGETDRGSPQVPAVGADGPRQWEPRRTVPTPELRRKTPLDDADGDWAPISVIGSGSHAAKAVSRAQGPADQLHQGGGAGASAAAASGAGARPRKPSTAGSTGPALRASLQRAGLDSARRRSAAQEPGEAPKLAVLGGTDEPQRFLAAPLGAVDRSSSVASKSVTFSAPRELGRVGAAASDGFDEDGDATSRGSLGAALGGSSRFGSHLAVSGARALRRLSRTETPPGQPAVDLDAQRLSPSSGGASMSPRGLLQGSSRYRSRSGSSVGSEEAPTSPRAWRRNDAVAGHMASLFEIAGHGGDGGGDAAHHEAASVSASPRRKRAPSSPQTRATTPKARQLADDKARTAIGMTVKVASAASTLLAVARNRRKQWNLADSASRLGRGFNDEGMAGQSSGRERSNMTGSIHAGPGVPQLGAEGLATSASHTGEWRKGGKRLEASGAAAGGEMGAALTRAERAKRGLRAVQTTHSGAAGRSVRIGLESPASRRDSDDSGLLPPHAMTASGMSEDDGLAASDTASMAAQLVAAQSEEERNFMAPVSARGFLARLVKRPGDHAPDGSLTWQARRRRARWLRRVSFGPGHIKALVTAQRNADKEAKESSLTTEVKRKHRHLLGAAMSPATAAAQVATAEEARRAGKRAVVREREVQRIVERRQAAMLAAAMARGDTSVMRAMTPAADRELRAKEALEAAAVVAAEAVTSPAATSASTAAARRPEGKSTHVAAARGSAIALPPGSASRGTVQSVDERERGIHTVGASTPERQYGDVSMPATPGVRPLDDSVSCDPQSAATVAPPHRPRPLLKPPAATATTGGAPVDSDARSPSPQGVDKSLQLPPPVQPAKRVAPRQIVPYQAQGDLSWYALDKLLLRRKLRDDKFVRAALRRYWGTLASYDKGTRVVLKERYLAFMSKVYLVLVPDAGSLARAAGSGIIAERGASAQEAAEAEAMAVATFDWERDTWAGEDEEALDCLDRDQLFRSVFELADMWCKSATNREYAQFLLYVLGRVHPRMAGCTGEPGAPAAPLPEQRWTAFEHPDLPRVSTAESKADAIKGDEGDSDHTDGLARKFEVMAFAPEITASRLLHIGSPSMQASAASRLGASLFLGAGASGSSGASMAAAAVAAASGSLARGHWAQDANGSWYNKTVDAAMRAARGAKSAEQAMVAAKATAIARAAAAALMSKPNASAGRGAPKRGTRRPPSSRDFRSMLPASRSPAGSSPRSSPRSLASTCPRGRGFPQLADTDEAKAASAKRGKRKLLMSKLLDAAARALAELRSADEGAASGVNIASRNMSGLTVDKGIGLGGISKALAAKRPVGIGLHRRPRLWELFGVRAVRVRRQVSGAAGAALVPGVGAGRAVGGAVRGGASMAAHGSAAGGDSRSSAHAQRRLLRQQALCAVVGGSGALTGRLGPTEESMALFLEAEQDMRRLEAAAATGAGNEDGDDAAGRTNTYDTDSDDSLADGAHAAAGYSLSSAAAAMLSERAAKQRRRRKQARKAARAAQRMQQEAEQARLDALASGTDAAVAAKIVSDMESRFRSAMGVRRRRHGRGEAKEDQLRNHAHSPHRRRQERSRRDSLLRRARRASMTRDAAGARASGLPMDRDGPYAADDSDVSCGSISTVERLYEARYAGGTAAMQMQPWKDRFGEAGIGDSVVGDPSAASMARVAEVERYVQHLQVGASSLLSAAFGASEDHAADMIAGGKDHAATAATPAGAQHWKLRTMMRAALSQAHPEMKLTQSRELQETPTATGASRALVAHWPPLHPHQRLNRPTSVEAVPVSDASAISDRDEPEAFRIPGSTFGAKGGVIDLTALFGARRRSPAPATGDDAELAACQAADSSAGADGPHGAQQLTGAAEDAMEQLPMALPGRGTGRASPLAGIKRRGDGTDPKRVGASELQDAAQQAEVFTADGVTRLRHRKRVWVGPRERGWQWEAFIVSRPAMADGAAADRAETEIVLGRFPDQLSAAVAHDAAVLAMGLRQPTNFDLAGRLQEPAEDIVAARPRVFWPARARPGAWRGAVMQRVADAAPWRAGMACIDVVPAGMSGEESSDGADEWARELERRRLVSLRHKREADRKALQDRKARLQGAPPTARSATDSTGSLRPAGSPLASAPAASLSTPLPGLESQPHFMAAVEASKREGFLLQSAADAAITSTEAPEVARWVSASLNPDDVDSHAVYAELAPSTSGATPSGSVNAAAAALLGGPRRGSTASGVFDPARRTASQVSVLSRAAGLASIDENKGVRNGASSRTGSEWSSSRAVSPAGAGTQGEAAPCSQARTGRGVPATVGAAVTPWAGAGTPHADAQTGGVAAAPILLGSRASTRPDVDVTAATTDSDSQSAKQMPRRLSALIQAASSAQSSAASPESAPGLRAAESTIVTPGRIGTAGPALAMAALTSRIKARRGGTGGFAVLVEDSEGSGSVPTTVLDMTNRKKNLFSGSNLGKLVPVPSPQAVHLHMARTEGAGTAASLLGRTRSLMTKVDAGPVSELAAAGVGIFREEGGVEALARAGRGRKWGRMEWTPRLSAAVAAALEDAGGAGELSSGKIEHIVSSVVLALGGGGSSGQSGSAAGSGNAPHSTPLHRDGATSVATSSAAAKASQWARTGSSLELGAAVKAAAAADTGARDVHRGWGHAAPVMAAEASGWVESSLSGGGDSAARVAEGETHPWAWGETGPASTALAQLAAAVGITRVRFAGATKRKGWLAMLIGEGGGTGAMSDDSDAESALSSEDEAAITAASRPGIPGMKPPKAKKERVLGTPKLAAKERRIADAKSNLKRMESMQSKVAQERQQLEGDSKAATAEEAVKREGGGAFAELSAALGLDIQKALQTMETASKSNKVPRPRRRGGLGPTRSTKTPESAKRLHSPSPRSARAGASSSKPAEADKLKVQATGSSASSWTKTNAEAEEAKRRGRRARAAAKLAGVLGSKAGNKVSVISPEEKARLVRERRAKILEEEEVRKRQALELAEARASRAAETAESRLGAKREAGRRALSRQQSRVFDAKDHAEGGVQPGERDEASRVATGDSARDALRGQRGGVGWADEAEDSDAVLAGLSEAERSVRRLSIASVSSSGSRRPDSSGSTTRLMRARVQASAKRAEELLATARKASDAAEAAERLATLRKELLDGYDAVAGDEDGTERGMSETSGTAGGKRGSIVVAASVAVLGRRAAVLRRRVKALQAEADAEATRVSELLAQRRTERLADEMKLAALEASIDAHIRATKAAVAQAKQGAEVAAASASSNLDTVDQDTPQANQQPHDGRLADIHGQATTSKSNEDDSPSQADLGAPSSIQVRSADRPLQSSAASITSLDGVPPASPISSIGSPDRATSAASTGSAVRTTQRSSHDEKLADSTAHDSVAAPAAPSAHRRFRSRAGATEASATRAVTMDPTLVRSTSAGGGRRSRRFGQPIHMNLDSDVLVLPSPLTGLGDEKHIASSQDAGIGGVSNQGPVQLSSTPSLTPGDPQLPNPRTFMPGRSGRGIELPRHPQSREQPGARPQPSGLSLRPRRASAAAATSSRKSWGSLVVDDRPADAKQAGGQIKQSHIITARPSAGPSEMVIDGEMVAQVIDISDRQAKTLAGGSHRRSNSVGDAQELQRRVNRAFRSGVAERLDDAAAPRPETGPVGRADAAFGVPLERPPPPLPASGVLGRRSSLPLSLQRTRRKLLRVRRLIKLLRPVLKRARPIGGAAAAYVWRHWAAAQRGAEAGSGTARRGTASSKSSTGVRTHTVSGVEIAAERTRQQNRHKGGGMRFSRPLSMGGTRTLSLVRAVYADDAVIRDLHSPGWQAASRLAAGRRRRARRPIVYTRELVLRLVNRGGAAAAVAEFDRLDDAGVASGSKWFRTTASRLHAASSGDEATSAGDSSRFYSDTDGILRSTAFGTFPRLPTDAPQPIMLVRWADTSQMEALPAHLGLTVVAAGAASVVLDATTAARGGVLAKAAGFASCSRRNDAGGGSHIEPGAGAMTTSVSLLPRTFATPSSSHRSVSLLSSVQPTALLLPVSDDGTSNARLQHHGHWRQGDAAAATLGTEVQNPRMRRPGGARPSASTGQEEQRLVADATRGGIATGDDAGPLVVMGFTGERHDKQVKQGLVAMHPKEAAAATAAAADREASRVETLVEWARNKGIGLPTETLDIAAAAGAGHVLKPGEGEAGSAAAARSTPSEGPAALPHPKPAQRSKAARTKPTGAFLGRKVPSLHNDKPENPRAHTQEMLMAPTQPARIAPVSEASPGRFDSLQTTKQHQAILLELAISTSPAKTPKEPAPEMRQHPQVNRGTSRADGISKPDASLFVQTQAQPMQRVSFDTLAVEANKAGATSAMSDAWQPGAPAPLPMLVPGSPGYVSPLRARGRPASLSGVPSKLAIASPLRLILDAQVTAASRLAVATTVTGEAAPKQATTHRAPQRLSSDNAAVPRVNSFRAMPTGTSSPERWQTAKPTAMSPKRPAAPAGAMMRASGLAPPRSAGGPAAGPEAAAPPEHEATAGDWQPPRVPSLPLAAMMAGRDGWLGTDPGRAHHSAASWLECSGSMSVRQPTDSTGQGTTTNSATTSASFAEAGVLVAQSATARGRLQRAASPTANRCMPLADTHRRRGATCATQPTREMTAAPVSLALPAGFELTPSPHIDALPAREMVSLRASRPLGYVQGRASSQRSQVMAAMARTDPNDDGGPGKTEHDSGRRRVGQRRASIVDIVVPEATLDEATAGQRRKMAEAAAAASERAMMELHQPPVVRRLARYEAAGFIKAQTTASPAAPRPMTPSSEPDSSRIDAALVELERVVGESPGQVPAQARPHRPAALRPRAVGAAPRRQRLFSSSVPGILQARDSPRPHVPTAASSYQLPESKWESAERAGGGKQAQDPVPVSLNEGKEGALRHEPCTHGGGPIPATWGQARKRCHQPGAGSSMATASTARAPVGFDLGPTGAAHDSKHGIGDASALPTAAAAVRAAAERLMPAFQARTDDLKPSAVRTLPPSSAAGLIPSTGSLASAAPGIQALARARADMAQADLIARVKGRAINKEAAVGIESKRHETSHLPVKRNKRQRAKLRARRRADRREAVAFAKMLAAPQHQPKLVEAGDGPLAEANGDDDLQAHECYVHSSAT